mgnify:CR=1 FL=1
MQEVVLTRLDVLLNIAEITRQVTHRTVVLTATELSSNQEVVLILQDSLFFKFNYTNMGKIKHVLEILLELPTNYRFISYDSGAPAIIVQDIFSTKNVLLSADGCNLIENSQYDEIKYDRDNRIYHVVENGKEKKMKLVENKLVEIA